MNGGGGLKDMMRQAQNMQKKIAEVQERIGEEETFEPDDELPF